MIANRPERPPIEVLEDANQEEPDGMAVEVGEDESEPQRSLGVAIERPRFPVRAERRGVPFVPLGMGAGELGPVHAASILLAQKQVRVRGGIARPAARVRGDRRGSPPRDRPGRALRCPDCCRRPDGRAARRVPGGRRRSPRRSGPHLQGIAKIEVGFGQAGLELEGAVECVDRLIEPSQHGQETARLVWASA